MIIYASEMSELLRHTHTRKKSKSFDSEALIYIDWGKIRARTESEIKVFQNISWGPLDRDGEGQNHQIVFQGKVSTHGSFLMSYLSMGI